MTDIIIQIGEDELAAALTPDRAPQTVERILAALPLHATASQWGEEIYFAIPVTMDEENAVSVVGKGDIGYWPTGRCFCIFYGRTPMSPSDEEIVPASPVNLIGRIADPDALKAHREGEAVTVRLADLPHDGA